MQSTTIPKQNHFEVIFLNYFQFMLFPKTGVKRIFALAMKNPINQVEKYAAHKSQNGK